MVSVIIPSYNHQSFLKARIDSVLNQTYQNFEIILLDDCSKDESHKIVQLYRNHPRFSHVIINDINSGSTFQQWNKGIDLAKGDLIWIAESDDLAESTFLQHMVKFFDQDPELGIAYCQSRQINEKNEILGTWKSWTDDLDKNLFENEFILAGVDYIERFLIVRNTIPNASAVIFNKDKFVAAGKASEGIKFCSDWLTWMKMLSSSNIAFSPDLLNSFRTHEKSVISSAWRNNRNLYIHSFERLMRQEFDKFLIKEKRENLRAINVKNKTIINNFYKEEAFYHIRNHNWAEGWSNLLISSKRKFNLNIILKAVLLFIKSTLTNRRIIQS